VLLLLCIIITHDLERIISVNAIRREEEIGMLLKILWALFVYWHGNFQFLNSNNI
jgi:hypothetical protein